MLDVDGAAFSGSGMIVRQAVGLSVACGGIALSSHLRDRDVSHRMAGSASGVPAAIIAGHALLQNVRRGHYELGLDAARGLRIATAFTELAAAI